MLAKNKHLRTCLFCNKQFEQSELIRLVKKDNELIIDKNKNMLGRGYWLKLTPQALQDTKLLTLLSKRTKSSISPKIVDELKQLYKDQYEKRNKTTNKSEI